METWKNIPEYEGLYMVSNLGNVKSLNFKKKKIQKNLALFKRSGYYSCMLVNGKIRKSYHVHRLIAKAFLNNPENKPCVNHKDGNKLNNNLSNLEWATYSENTKHAFNNGLMNITNKIRENGKIFHKKNIQKLTLDTYTGIYYDSYQYACDALSLNYQSVIKKYYRKKFNRLQYV